MRKGRNLFFILSVILAISIIFVGSIMKMQTTVYAGTIESSKVKLNIINNRKYVTAKQEKYIAYVYIQEKGKVKRIKVDIRYAELRIDSKSTIRKGKKHTYKVEIIYDDEIKLLENSHLKWSSSNKKVVSVDKNGTIRALKPGIAYITVKTDFDKISCKIKVKAKNGYTNKELCKLAKNYYYTTHGHQPPIVEVDSVDGDEVTIHIYEFVNDGGGRGHTATYAWYSVSRKTGKGKDLIKEEKIDLTKFSLD